MTDNINSPKPGEEESHDKQHDEHEKYFGEEYEEEPLEEEEYDEHIDPDADDAEDHEDTENKSDFMSSMTEKIKQSGGQFPIKKVALIALVVLILIVAGVFTVRSMQANKLRQQAATSIIAMATPMQDIQQYLGVPVTLGRSVIGTIDKTGENGELTFAVQGSKTSGTLTAVLNNGQLTSIQLQTANGSRYNVLQDEASYKQQQQVKQEVSAKEKSMEDNFNNAETALRNKNYQAAITGFQQSIQNNYQVAASYEYLGFSYSQVNQFQQCVTAYNKYVELETENHEAYYQIAYCDLQMYQTGDALINLDKSCKLGYALACSAAMQIREQLNQKPTNSSQALSPSPQQTIDQQQQMQQQLQNDKSSTQILNGATVPTTQNSATPQGSMPQQVPTNQSMTPQGSMPEQGPTNQSMTPQGSMPEQGPTNQSMTPQGSMPQSISAP
ncbi:MAG: cytochrome c oxidase assembly factor Coa1 family protein, partial [Gammaproteobacteria bacterium]